MAREWPTNLKAAMVLLVGITLNTGLEIYITHRDLMKNRKIGTEIRAGMSDRYTGTDADMDWKAQRESNHALATSRPSAKL